MRREDVIVSSPSETQKYLLKGALPAILRDAAPELPALRETRQHQGPNHLSPSQALE